MELRNGAIIIEGHVQGLSNTRSLGKSGIPVIVIDKSSCVAQYSKYCQKFFICPDFISEEFVPFLIELAKKESLKDWVLIPSNDHAVYSISKYKDKLELYYKVITPEIQIIEQIYNKLKLLEIAKRVGIPIPETQNFKSPEDRIIDNMKFPVITKGQNGLSFYRGLGKKAYFAENYSQLLEQLRIIAAKFDITKTFTQEVIPFDGTNKTISFTAFCVNGEIKSQWSGVKLREHPLQFGTATFAKSVYTKECYLQSIPLLKELNYTGVCEIEYLFDPRDKLFKLIEINPRTWLWVGLAKACGIDYAKMIYNYANKIDFTYPKEYNTDYSWINPFSDTAFAILGILVGKLKIKDYFISLLKGKKVNALYEKNDIKPSIGYLFALIKFIRNR